MISEDDVIRIYTDGACKGNPGPGGYGIILTYKSKMREMSAGYRKTTNNRMELLACIVALETLKNSGSKVIIYSDSKYVCDAVTKKWLIGWHAKGYKKIKNPDLWIRFYKIFKIHQVTCHWIKGHAGHSMNERCDVLAVEASLSSKLLVDSNYENGQSEGLL